VGTDGSPGLPAVRIAQWTKAFGAHGMVLPVCSDNFAPVLDQLASLLNQAMSLP
jgi:hypothetical protein